MAKRPRILVFAATNSKTSINKQLAIHAAKVLQHEIAPQVEFDILDLNDFEMPIYSPEREQNGGIPALAHKFYDKIGSADGLIISFAEYNGTYSAAFKNLFDWTSRIEKSLYQNKPVVMLATSPGPGGGQNVLKVAVEGAPFHAAEVKGSLSIGNFFDAFDADAGQLTGHDQAKALREVLFALNEAMMVAA